MKIAFLVMLVLAFLLCVWLMWKMLRGAVVAGHAQDGYFRRLRRSRDPHRDAE